MSKLRVSLLISLLSLLASFRSFNNFRLSFRLHVENANNDLTERDIQLDEDTIVAYMMGDFPVPTTFQLDQQAIENENSIEKIDYTKLPPHDPRFVDMPYPTEGGPLSAAYARHMLWRRKLNDGDRIQWQKWAIYKRLGLQYTFDYSVEDFVNQNLMKDADARARKLFARNQTVEATLWSSFERGMRADQAEQVQGFMMGFYKAFNCKNPNLMRPLWLPNRDCELVIPGWLKARGNSQVYKLYRQFFRDVKPFCKIDPEIVTVQTFGNLAVVISIENIGRGYDARPARKIKGVNGLESAIQANSKGAKGHKMLAVSIVRRANKQWRMLSHTSTKLETSSFTNNQVNASTLPDLRSTRRPGNGFFSSQSNPQIVASGKVGDKNPPIDEVIRGLGTVAMKVKRAEDGSSEMVVALNSDKDSDDGDDDDGGAAGRVHKEISLALKKLVKDKKLPAELKDIIDRDMKSKKKPPKVIDMDNDVEDQDEVATKDDALYARDQVDLSWPIPRQTVFVLRVLVDLELINQEEKGLLIKQVVDGLVSQDVGGTGDAFIVTAYKAIFLDGLKTVINRGSSSSSFTPKGEMMLLGITELEEFAQQCQVLLARLQPKN